MHLLTLVLNPREVSSDCYAAYDLWADVWNRAFRELDPDFGALHSDDFSRQDEVLCLFDGSRCAALSCFRSVNIMSPPAIDDSYFQAWSLWDMARLKRGGNAFVCVNSYFTVHPDYRGPELRVKHQLMEAIVRHFENNYGHCASMTGTTRNDRGVNKLVAQYGFETIRAGARMHGTEVDLTAYYRKSST